ncbi:putative SNF2 family helicase [Aspergillus ibericus CBS 121593]|uniref:SNF2 family helicase n=1 Tax=Aspergillus ibericus CBS 121593 TaxID=1448316 RepID=A0A395GWQ6_9EURO|nr:SNF2 family helicase [Aspergillus ibericus CBS 121593]RAK99458.1 SNF2 family helicase [Aspergillus ibericus CBS 121593]
MESPHEDTGLPADPASHTTGLIDVQMHHPQELSPKRDTLDVSQTLLDSIDRRREAIGHKEAFALSCLALQMNARDKVESLSFPSPLPQDDQAYSGHINGDDSLFVPEAGHLSLGLPFPDAVPNLPDQEIAEILQGYNQMNGEISHVVDFLDVPDDTEDQDCPSEWPDEELEASTKGDLTKSKFHAIQRWFKGLEKKSLEDVIRFEAAKQQEYARKKRVESRKALERQEESSDLDLDEPDVSTAGQLPAEQKTESSAKATNKPQPRRRRHNRLSADEKRKSKALGLELLLGRRKKHEAPAKRPRKRKERGPGFDSGSGPKKRLRGGDLKAKKYLEALLASGVISDAHENASLDAIPDSIDKNKTKALTRLVASIPSADQNEAKSDKRKVLEATRRFTNSARSDGKLGWKIKGLNTSLYHYQLLGAAFMRDRENSQQSPLGGLFCDIMGLGKTIQALANIVDGKPSDPDDPVRTTLIVVPSQLVSHWKAQITKHCDKKAIGEVLIYKANSRLETLDTVGSLEKYDVIITTYDEVRRSYPPTQAPSDNTNDDKIQEWWNDFYEERIGPLHQIRFYRVVLDEGHIIKNHLSSVSVAVRALTGRYKWILSGTPVHNYLEEFYPLFDFLGVPRIGNMGHFMKHFCSDDDGHGRLVNLLRAFLFRRTHKSRLFSLPVIKLPDVGERIVKVKFCTVERELYNAISEVFIENINGCARLEQPKLAQYRCFLSMILMLRMFCSHLLTTQHIVKRLLSEGYLMKKLSRIAKGTGDRNDTSYKIVQWLVSVRMNTTVLNDRENEDVGQCLEELHGDKMALAANFRQFMSELHEQENWDERLERTNCPSCEFVPVNPVITSCKHLYCEECYYSLLNDKNTMLGKPTCGSCLDLIEEAAYFEEQPKQAQSVQSTSSGAKNKEKRLKKKTSTKKGPGSGMRRITWGQTESDEESDVDEETDWIKACAQHMPSAKLTKIRDILATWLAEDSSSKVVIFTQFLDFVRILVTMCKTEGWPSACLTGKQRLAAREENMRVFSDKEGQVRVLIASLKAGGIGIDLSAANKCILVDLWWNEAIQEQAFCRLFRIGQESTVQFVKLIVESSIDDYLLDLQTRKTAGISSTMSEDVLKDRDTIETLLRMFAHVEKDGNGVLHLQATTSSRNVRKKTGFRPSFGVF